MKNFLIIFAIVFAVCSASAEKISFYPDVKILKSDSRGITLEFRPVFLTSTKVVAESGEEFEIPQFQFGYSQNYTAGEPDLKSRTIQIALPSKKGNIVRVLAADFETMQNVSVAPIPSVESMDGFGATKLQYTKKTVNGNYLPQEIAALNSIGVMRGWQYGNLVITPLQYSASAKTLKKYSRIVVRIDFGEQEPQNIFNSNDEVASTFLNYETAKQWNTIKRSAKINAINSVLSTGIWIKVEVVENGMYKIDASYLRAAGVEPTALNSIYDVKIFGADGRNLAEDLSTPRPNDLPQLAVKYIDNNNNGKFDNDDYLIFYGQGSSGWNYDPVQKKFAHYTNPYTNSNYYFIGISAQNTTPKQIPLASISGNAGGTVTQVVGKVFFDEEKVNFNQSGQNWVSAPFNSGSSRVISNKLDGWISGTSIRYVYDLYGRSDAIASFTIEESGMLVASVGIPAMTQHELNSVESEFASRSLGSSSNVPVLTDSRSNLKFTYQGNSNTANGWIDWFEIYYQQKLVGTNNVLQFDSPDTSGTVQFGLSDFTTNSISVFDVTNCNQVIELPLVTGTFMFKDTLSSGRVKKYWVGTSANYKTPKSFTKIPNSNVHGNNGAKFVIITHSEFKSEAQRLKNYKENLLGTKKISTVVVDIDTLYNEFGIGMPDPTAMRDFLYYAVNNWNVKPEYVLFFGDASFDYKGYLKTDKNWIPTYETAEFNDKIESYAMDDYFAMLETNPLKYRDVSLAHGRICVRSSAEARLVVDRIIAYESNPIKGTWKNTLTLVADDAWVPEGNEGTLHTGQVETLANVYTPKSFELKKIYIGDYATAITASGRRKPEARKAILDQINKEGTLIVNYTGHGNPKVWAHESILSLDDVKTQFYNGNKLPFIVAATCDWGRFEEAGEQSSAELIMVNPNGGAIGVLSATRAVYSGANSELNYKFYNYLFSNNGMRLGDAYMATKNSGVDNMRGNKDKFHLFGDPTLRLAVPEATLRIDSINGIAIANGDTLRALQKIRIKGTVVDAANNVNSNFNGTALLTVYDSQRNKYIAEVGGTYLFNGAIIFKGENSIVNGKFDASFIVPKDISYENKNGRISVYFSNDSTDGRGFTINVIVGGSSILSTTDVVGPEIQIYFDNYNFRSGDLVGKNPKLIVTLKDSNGVNTAGTGIGHLLEAWIDDASRSIDLTETYKGKLNSYQEGTAEYQLSDLSPGNHSVKVRAWDVYNNSSTTEAAFVVASADGLTIEKVYNFPNPVSTTTSFTFQHNQLVPIDVEIKIYSVAGRLIHTIQRSSFTDRFVKIDWDRRDADGDKLGNGIYFYKVIAKTIDGKYISEAIGKMSVVE